MEIFFHRHLSACLLAVSLPVLAQPPADLALQPLAGDFNQPLAAVHAADGSGRLFVVEQSGHIWIIVDGQRRATPFADLSGQISASRDEQGLLGLAFDPDFASNRLLYVSYTRLNGNQLQSVLASLRVSPNNPDQVDSTSLQVILTIDQNRNNHNGGHLAFGPDGYLYLGIGDGGGTNDPGNNAQNLTTLLGTLLRLEVDGLNGNYTSPADNPFVGNGSARDEIWAYGLRNPWRWSFDRLTGDLFIGDVGQDYREEINQQPAGVGGLNFGWPQCEGDIPTPTRPDGNCGGNRQAPIISYAHDASRSVTGGYRYWGAIGGLRGYYAYGDFVSGKIWFAALQGEDWVSTLWQDTAYNISSFGEDESGELYVVDYNGTVYRFHSATTTPASFQDDFE